MEAKDIKDAGSFDKEDPGKSRDELSYPSELVGAPLNYFDRGTVAGWLGDDEDDDMDEGPDDQGEDEPVQRSFRGIILHPDPA